MPKTVEDLGLTRFHLYADFIWSLTLNNCILNRELFAFLIAQLGDNNSRPLLPNLRVLLVACPPDDLRPRLWPAPDSGWGATGSRPVCDAEDLTLLFLGPSVHTLAVYCSYLAISPTAITLRSPNIRDARLGYAYRIMPSPSTVSPSRMSPEYDPAQDDLNLGFTRERPLGTWPQACIAEMHGWNHLERLSITGAFLRWVTFEGLSQISGLRELTIFGSCDDANWDQLASENIQLTALTSLFLERVPQQNAACLFRCSSLMQNLVNLFWTEGGPPGLPGTRHPNTAAVDVLSNLSRFATSLKVLGIDYWAKRFQNGQVWAQPEMAGLLSARQLDAFYLLDRFDAGEIHMPFLTSAGESLTMLQLEGVRIRLDQLPIIADAYPHLTHLRVDLRFTDVDNGTRAGTAETSHQQVIQLVLKIGFDHWPDVLDDAADSMMHGLKRWVRLAYHSKILSKLTYLTSSQLVIAT